MADPKDKNSGEGYSDVYLNPPMGGESGTSTRDTVIQYLQLLGYEVRLTAALDMEAGEMEARGQYGTDYEVGVRHQVEAFLNRPLTRHERALIAFVTGIVSRDLY